MRKDLVPLHRTNQCSEVEGGGGESGVGAVFNTGDYSVY